MNYCFYRLSIDWNLIEFSQNIQELTSCLRQTNWFVACTPRVNQFIDVLENKTNNKVLWGKCWIIHNYNYIAVRILLLWEFWNTFYFYFNISRFCMYLILNVFVFFYKKNPWLHIVEETRSAGAENMFI